MKRIDSQYVLAQPSRRPLKIFSSDPMLGRSAGSRITIQVANERLSSGPSGARLEVIDYDATKKRFYPPVNLDEAAILMQGGLDPTESDPRFHQQMVYAVAMRTLENFDRALGRRIELRRGKKYPRLRIFPHAFHAANAFYDRKLHALLFGYFRADKADPGANLPGQNVFTCLSHDIIAHEMTHALVDRLRRYFMEPSNEDVLAFHEGFSDIVALFQHFSFHELLREQIQRNRGDIRSPNYLVELARQFGFATGSGQALRSALDKPNAKLYQSTIEPHHRGSILVAAVFDAFFNTYQRRIKDLIRIATGGSGQLPDGDLHPDLVNRISGEASKTAQQILTMCIRAFDYLPPVDITFGDYLRALVTADYELSPDDDFGQRSALIDAFRIRGIYAQNVASLAEESLLWENADRDFPKLPIATMELLPVLVSWANAFSRSSSTWAAWNEQPSATGTSPEQHSVNDEETDLDFTASMAGQLHQYATQNAVRLGLDVKTKIEVHGFHSVFRVAPDGQLLIELVAQFAQKEDAKRPELGGLPLRGGTTVIASADGTVRYLITKPLPSSGRPEAVHRFERQLAYVQLCDAMDASCAYCGSVEFTNRMRARMSLSALHHGAFS